jgi:hypothetical protein
MIAANGTKRHWQARQRYGMGGRMGLVDWVPQGNCMFS